MVCLGQLLAGSVPAPHGTLARPLCSLSPSRTWKARTVRMGHLTGLLSGLQMGDTRRTVRAPGTPALPHTRVFPPPTSDHSLKLEVPKAKTLPAQGWWWGGAVRLPTCVQAESQRCQMNTGPRRLHGAGYRHQGLWLAKSLRNSSGCPATGPAGEGGKHLSGG